MLPNRHVENRVLHFGRQTILLHRRWSIKQMSLSASWAEMDARSPSAKTKRTNQNTRVKNLPIIHGVLRNRTPIFWPAFEHQGQVESANRMLKY